MAELTPEDVVAGMHEALNARRNARAADVADQVLVS